MTILIALNIKRFWVAAFCISVILIAQFYTTSFKNLTYLDNDGQRVQQERSVQYPLINLNFVIKVFWLNPGRWIEKNPVVIGLSRIEENFFKTLNINYYFFGGTPRNIPEDFEKLPFILLPFSALGIYLLIKKQEYKIFFLLLSLPLIFTAFTGTDNRYGIISFFPLLVILIKEGIEKAASKFNNTYIFYFLFIPLIILTLIMQINYVQK